MTNTYRNIKYSTSKIIVFVVVAFSLIFPNSCNKNTDSNEGDKVYVKFFASSLLISPSQLAHETKIDQLTVLIFTDNGSGYTYQNSKVVTNLIDFGNNITQFNLSFDKEANPVKLYFITNVNTALANNPPIVNETETQVKQKLKMEFTNSGINTNFPMWGEYEFLGGITQDLNNTMINVSVLRAIARADIITDEVSSVFKLMSVQVYRANNAIQLIPNSYTGNLLVSQASVPTGSTTTINTSPINTTSTSSIGQLYIPESDEPTDLVSQATCIVVGGQFNGNLTTTYYRLDFNTDTVTNPIGQILRNHHYGFNITNVFADGWTTPDEAANNTPTNFTVEVDDWTHSFLDVNMGGNNYFKISSREAVVADTVNANTALFVATNVRDYSLQWSDETGVALGTPLESIDNGTFFVAKSRNSIFIKALVAGTREDYFLIVAGRANILVKITQNAG